MALDPLGSASLACGDLPHNPSPLATYGLVTAGMIWRVQKDESGQPLQNRSKISCRVRLPFGHGQFETAMATAIASWLRIVALNRSPTA